MKEQNRKEWHHNLSKHSHFTPQQELNHHTKHCLRIEIHSSDSHISGLRSHCIVVLAIGVPVIFGDSQFVPQKDSRVLKNIFLEISFLLRSDMLLFEC